MHHADLPNTFELIAEMSRLSKSLDAALSFIKDQAQRYAEAEDKYRLARSTAQLEAADVLRRERNVDRPTVDDKRAYVDLQTSKERVDAHLSEQLLKTGYEAVRSRRAQLSAIQSVANAVRAEAEFSRTGPGP